MRLQDYQVFEEILEETRFTRPMRICGFCLGVLCIASIRTTSEDTCATIEPQLMGMLTLNIGNVVNR